MEINGKKIRFFRKRSGLTLKRLGELVGFSPSTAEVRMHQYESGTRTPRPTSSEKISGILDVSTGALTVPSMENTNSIMHILFALEDEMGLEICNDHMIEQGRLDSRDYDTLIKFTMPKYPW